MNPYLTSWFAGLSLAGMGLAAFVGDIGFRRLAVRYGAQDLGPPPGLLRALFRVLLTLWVYLIGAKQSGRLLRSDRRRAGHFLAYSPMRHQ